MKMQHVAGLRKLVIVCHWDTFALRKVELNSEEPKRSTQVRATLSGDMEGSALKQCMTSFIAILLNSKHYIVCINPQTEGAQ